MAKIQLKSDNITPFGGLYSIFNQFNRSGVRETVDSFLGRRSLDPKAFSYGDVFASLFANYLCGGDCIEDVMDIKNFWDGHDNIRIASSDTIERALRGLSCDNTTYMNDNNVAYDFNTADKLNSLMLRLLKTTKQLNPGDCIDLDFDHQFIACDKKDSKYSYKKAEGYFPGVATVGGLIVGIENRDANTNVKFHQADTLKRIIERLEIESRVVIRNFRADCGSYSEAIIGYVKDHCEHFYIRANNCQSRRTEFMEHTDWTPVHISGMDCDVASFKFDSFIPEENLRLVVQRTKLSEEDPAAESEGLFGTEYVYRCIVTNDWSNSEKDIIAYYNKRGASDATSTARTTTSAGPISRSRISRKTLFSCWLRPCSRTFTCTSFRPSALQSRVLTSRTGSSASSASSSPPPPNGSVPAGKRCSTYTHDDKSTSFYSVKS